MIVADTNLIAYLTIPGDRTTLAKQILQKDATWVAPRMWQSEFQNVIAIYLNQGLYTLDEGLEFIQTAKNLLKFGQPVSTQRPFYPYNPGQWLYIASFCEKQNA